MKKKMKRILAVVVTFVMLLGSLPVMLPEEMRSGQGMMRARRSGCRSMI